MARELRNSETDGSNQDYWQAARDMSPSEFEELVAEKRGEK